MKINYIDTSTTLYILRKNGSNVIVSHKEKHYPELINLLREGTNKSFAKADILIKDLASLVELKSRGAIVKKDGHFVISTTEEKLDPIIHSYIKKFKKSGSGKFYKALLKMDKKVKKIRNQELKTLLIEFLEQGEFPVLANGNFLAYKALKNVGGDLVDFHSGKVAQNIGTVVKIDRNKVEASPYVSCGPGLHAASFDYVKKVYSGKPGAVFVVCEINPKDCVSITKAEYKLRCSKYKILGLMPEDNSFRDAFVPWKTFKK